MRAQVFIQIVFLSLTYVSSSVFSVKRDQDGKPKNWLCRQIVGAREYEEFLDTPLRPDAPLPDGYWTDYRLLKALDALVENRVPLSATYLLKAKGEKADKIVATALNQPAASAKKFLSAAVYAHSSLNLFCQKAGVTFRRDSKPNRPTSRTQMSFSVESS